MPVRIARMCSTKFIPVSNVKGSRVKATHLTTRKSVTLGWDHALGVDENHLAVATALLGREPDFQTAVDGGGFIFGVFPLGEDGVFKSA